MSKTTRSRGSSALVAAGVMTALLWACGDELAEPGLPFDDPDAAPEASLPPPKAEPDAGIVDARVPYDGSPGTVDCDASPCAVALAAGHEHYCAIIAGGSVRCWGEPALLGTNAAKPGVVVEVDGISNAVSIAASKESTCVVLTDGSVDCWGGRQPSPERITEVSRAKRVVLGLDVSCAIDESDALVCWGDSDSLGRGRRVVEIASEKATRASIATDAAFVVSSTGALRSWGSDVLTLGRGTSTVDLTPVRVLGLPAVADVVSSALHVCTIGTLGEVHCWGDGVLLGAGYVRRELVPVPVAFESAAYPQQLSARESHSCARMTDGTVHCWGGNNAYGELGQPRPIGVYVPAKVEALDDIVAVAVGLRSSCALSRGGSIRCWGNNERGQLGRGDRDTRRHAIPEAVVFH